MISFFKSFILRSLLRLNLDNNEISCLSNTIKTTPDLPDDLYCRDILQIRLNGNRIRHLKRMCLEIFPKLEHLELRSNNISKLCGVQKLFKLESLDISENRIRSIDSRETENLLKLKVLKAEKNKLKNLDFMTGLEELREVDMSTNCIQSCLNLRALEGLPNVQYFNCHGNPVATKNLYRHFVLSHLKFLLEFDHQPVERTDHEKAASIMKNYRESTTRVLKTALLGTVEPPTSTDNSR